MAEKTDQQESIRALMRKGLPAEEVASLMVASMREAMNATKTEWFECSHCHKKSPLVLPNMFERVKAAQLWVQELEGRVGTHREAPAQAKANVGNLSEMSDDDLLALLADGNGDTDEDS